MKLVVLFSLAMATAAAAQPPPAGGLDRTQQVGAWTVSDLGGKPGDDSEREVRVARSLDGLTFVLHRSSDDGAEVTIKFSRCEGLNWNSGFSLEGEGPARAAQVKDEVKDAFKDDAKRCPPKPGEEAALLEGFDAADALAESWIRARPFVYPPDPDAAPKR